MMDKIPGRNPIPKNQNKIPVADSHKETLEEKTAISQGAAKANGKAYKASSKVTTEHPNIDNETKIREDASELIVITKTKKLAAYVITITEKSPKKFRTVFISRMQNYCLDCIENLIEANSLRMDNQRNKEKRKDCQHNAFLKLKLLSYMAFLSYENSCILKNQYEQISWQLADCINLLVAWRKSDAERKGA